MKQNKKQKTNKQTIKKNQEKKMYAKQKQN